MNLFILTNTEKLFLLISEKEKKIFYQESVHNKKISEHFFLVLNKVLKANKLSLKDIKNIYAGIGPGSYLVHRCIVTFLKTIKILQKQCQIFTINNLLYQAGKKEKIISLITANKKEYYLFIVNKGEIINKEYNIPKNKLKEIVQKYKGYEIYQDLNNIDHWQQFQKMKKQFRKRLNWKEIQAIEL